MSPWNYKVVKKGPKWHKLCIFCRAVFRYLSPTKHTFYHYHRKQFLSHSVVKSLKLKILFCVSFFFLIVTIICRKKWKNNKLLWLSVFAWSGASILSRGDNKINFTLAIFFYYVYWTPSFSPFEAVENCLFVWVIFLVMSLLVKVK